MTTTIENRFNKLVIFVRSVNAPSSASKLLEIQVCLREPPFMSLRRSNMFKVCEKIAAWLAAFPKVGSVVAAATAVLVDSSVLPALSCAGLAVDNATESPGP